MVSADQRFAIAANEGPLPAIWFPVSPRTKAYGARWAAIVALAAVALAGGCWCALAPDFVVQVEIRADSSGPGGRMALAEAALRFAPGAGWPVQLSEGGAALLVTERDRDRATAQRRSRALVDAILNAKVAQPISSPALPPEVDGRGRLLAAVSELASQSATVSASLTAVTRDLAAATQNAPDRHAVRPTAEKGAAALAELQIARFQLLARYQADFPAVLALDAQIRDLKAFLAADARQAGARPTGPSEAETMLIAERDRLRQQWTELDDRRVSLQSALTDLASRPTHRADRALPTDMPILVEAAMTQSATADQRAVAAGGSLAAGLLCVIWLMARRRTCVIQTTTGHADLCLSEGWPLLPPGQEPLSFPSMEAPALKPLVSCAGHVEAAPV